MELTAIPHQCKSRMNLPSKTYSKVTMIGSKASGYLSRQLFSGEVAIASPRAVYIITNEGDILAGCATNQQPHPRSFLTNYDLSSIQVAQRVWVKGNHVCFSDGTRLDLSGSKVWNRQAPDAENAVSRTKLSLKFDNLLRTATDLHEGENLGLGLPLFFSKNPSYQQLPPNGISPLISVGVIKIQELLSLYRCRNPRFILDLVQNLIGVGHGLTPSGDDFVGGLLFMVYHLSNIYPTHKWWNKADTSKLLNYSRSMTSQISHALLTDLAGGQSHESLHDLADDVLSRESRFDSERHVRRITQIGHSSGWDMLTGMLVGLFLMTNEITEWKP